jgi:alpha-tubulin suppressor-like RCC1 family protein
MFTLPSQNFHIISELPLMSCVLLTDDNTVWGCGWNAYGQLGMPPEQVLSTWKLTRLEMPDSCSGSAKGITCGAWSTVVFLT